MTASAGGVAASSPLGESKRLEDELNRLLSLIARLSGCRFIVLRLRTVSGDLGAMLGFGTPLASGAARLRLDVNGDDAGLLEFDPSAMGEAEATELAEQILLSADGVLSERNGRVRAEIAAEMQSLDPQGSDNLEDEIGKGLRTVSDTLARVCGGTVAFADLGRIGAPDFGSGLSSELEVGADAGSQYRLVADLSAGGLRLGELTLLQSPETYVVVARANRSLLSHVASNVGALLAIGFTVLETRQRDRQYETLLKGFKHIYSETHRAIHSSADRDGCLDHILAEALLVAEQSIPGASILDVRWIEQARSSSYLLFRKWRGGAWNELDDARLGKRFPIGGRQTSLGATVCGGGQPMLVRDVSSDSRYDATFEGVLSMIIAPIAIEDERQGVLDLRSVEAELTLFDLGIATALGEQLGLVTHLLSSIRSEQDARVQLDRLQAEQLQAMEDLRHQLNSPITQLERRTRRLIAGVEGLDSATRRRLYPVRGLARKSHNVTKALRYFVELARTDMLTAKIKPVGRDEFERLLEEEARDAEYVSRQPVRFIVDGGSMHENLPPVCYFDLELVEQAIASLLDNAGKYSFPESKVTVSAVRWSTQGFAIRVENDGQAISPANIEDCKQRGWRGSSLSGIEVTGEGSGIGLWVVDRIMQAHGGRLHIGVQSSRTTVELRFPFTKNRS